MTGYIRQINNIYYLCSTKTTSKNICELNSKAIALVEKNIWKLNQKIEYSILEYDSFFGNEDNAFKFINKRIIVIDPIYNSKMAIDK